MTVSEKSMVAFVIWFCLALATLGLLFIHGNKATIFVVVVAWLGGIASVNLYREYRNDLDRE